MTLKRSWSAVRRPLAITAVAASALLALSACASNGVDPQQQAQQSAVAQQADSPSDDSGAVAQSGAEQSPAF